MPQPHSTTTRTYFKGTDEPLTQAEMEAVDQKMSGKIDKTFSMDNPPTWMLRALDPATPTTEANESVRTMSAPLNQRGLGGQWIVFPSIRLVKGQLMRADNEDEAREWAMDKKDFMVFDTKGEAELFSHRFSDMIGQSRNDHAKKIRLMSDPEFRNYKENGGG